MKFSRIIASALAAMLLVGGIASAQSTLTLYQGAQINAKMRSTLDTATAQIGDRFVMDVVAPYPSGDPSFQGSTVVGEVKAVTRAGQGRKAAIKLQFDTLRLSDGTVVDISATATNNQQTKDLRNGGKVALSTIGGMLLGNIIGKTIFHTGGGGLVGAAGGFLYGYNSKSNFKIPQGSTVQIQLNQNVTIRRQASPPR